MIKVVPKSLGLVLGALLVVTVLGLLMHAGSSVDDPTEAEGDPDGALGRPIFLVFSLVGVAVYGAVVMVVRRYLKHRDGRPPAERSATVPRPAILGFVVVLTYLLVIGDAGLTFGQWVPVPVAVLGGLLWSLRPTGRVSGLAWAIGAAIGGATGGYLVWMASYATTI